MCAIKRKNAKTFEDLIVWRKAHEFVLEIYGITRDFPQSEIYGLTSQIRRASVSIAANIAEGFKKRSKADKIRYLNISQGSCEEVRYYLILIQDLKYADSSFVRDKLEEVSKLLEAYSTVIRRDSMNSE